MLAFPVVYWARCGLLAGLLLSRAASAPAAGVTVGLALQAAGGAAVRGGQTGVRIVADVAPGWHINAHRPNQSFLIPTTLRFTLPPAITTAPVRYPNPDSKQFAFAPGQTLLVYQGTVVMTTVLSVPGNFAATRVRVAATLRYQACNDTTCLPPAAASAELVIPVRAVVPAPPASGVTAAPAPASRIDVGAWMARRGLGVTLLLVALLGLGLNLTPCVYPLISVTVAYFGTQGERRSGRVAALAATYVLGITLSFSALGVAAALSGGVFGAALQRPPVLLFIAALLVALALSAFGLFQLRPPAALLRRTGGTAHGALGALLMGVTMGIVAAPCVGPVVLGLLLYVGSRQSVRLGMALFFALGLGMGLPYLVLALAAGSLRRLPRSGEWLVWVERLFGVVLLGLAAYFVAPLLPETAGRLLLPGVLGAGGVYLGFIDRSGRERRAFRAVQRVVGVGAVAVAVWGALPPHAASAIRWHALAATPLAAARRNQQPAIIDFVADWCIPCREMAQTTFADAAVQREAERFAMFKADVTRDTDETARLENAYQVRGVPTLIFVDSSGAEVRRLVGYVGADELLRVMRGIR